MITASISGLGAILSRRIAQLKSIANPANEQDKIMRIVALSVLGGENGIHDRIHEQGKASDGADIGTYSGGYMAVRTGKFKSNSKVTKGKNKGVTRDTGVFTKGENKGNPRPKFNRTDSKKVIISLTKKLELSYVVQATAKGYGIGFIDKSVNIAGYDNSTSSYDKSQYVEATYGKKIFSLTKQERQEALRITELEVSKRLKS